MKFNYEKLDDIYAENDNFIFKVNECLEHIAEKTEFGFPDCAYNSQCNYKYSFYIKMELEPKGGKKRNRIRRAHLYIRYDGEMDIIPIGNSWEKDAIHKLIKEFENFIEVWNKYGFIKM